MKNIISLLIIVFFINLSTAQCNTPIDLQVVSNHSFYVTWNPSNDSNLWDIEYGEHGFTPTGIPTIEDRPYAEFPANQIPHSINYDVYVRSDCGTSTSEWVGPVTFYNYCADYINTPYYDINFDNEFIPYCWTQANQGNPDIGISGFNKSNWEAANFANTGNNQSAKINLQGTSINDWLILPANIGFAPVRADIPLTIDFNIALTQHNTTESAILGTDDRISLLLSIDSGNTWTILHDWDSNSSISNTGESFHFDLNDNLDLNDSLYFNCFLIGFWTNSGSLDDSNVDFFIDNLSFNAPIGDGNSVEDLESKGFSYYPNPIKNSFNISANENIDHITIYNHIGQEVDKVVINSLNKNVNIDTLEKGIYFMKVKIGLTKGFVPLIKN